MREIVTIQIDNEREAMILAHGLNVVSAMALADAILVAVAVNQIPEAMRAGCYNRRDIKKLLSIFDKLADHFGRPEVEP